MRPIADRRARRPGQDDPGRCPAACSSAPICAASTYRPGALMLDEPFGALDAFTREELWDVFQELWMRRRFTCMNPGDRRSSRGRLSRRRRPRHERAPGTRHRHPSCRPAAAPNDREHVQSARFIDIVHAIRGEIAHSRNGEKIAVARREGDPMTCKQYHRLERAMPYLVIMGALVLWEFVVKVLPSGSSSCRHRRRLCRADKIS